MPNYYNQPYQGWQQPQQYQPQPQYQPPMQQGWGQPSMSQGQKQSRGNVIRVMGPESAMSYPMGPNMEVVMFDAYNPTFYLVSTDDSGYKTIRTFDDFKERSQPEASKPAPDIDTSGFATKEDLSDIKSDIANLTEMMKGLM